MSAYLAPDPGTGDLLVECVLCDHLEAFTPTRPGDWTSVRPAAAAAAATHTATHRGDSDTTAAEAARSVDRQVRTTSTTPNRHGSSSSSPAN